MSFDASNGPPTKQMYRPNNGGGGGGGGFALNTELEPPDEPEVQREYDPDAIARIHFLIHSQKMLCSFAKSFPQCTSTQMAQTLFTNLFPNLPPKIDHLAHREMNYQLNDNQKGQVDGWIQTFYQTMTHKVKVNQREFQVWQFFKHRKPEAWGYVIQQVRMIQMLQLRNKWGNMSDGSKNAMWRYMDLLYKDAKQFMGFKNLEKMIPQEMRTQVENIMQNADPANPLASVQSLMSQMPPETMQNFVKNVCSNGQNMQNIMQHVSDAVGQDMGQFMQKMVGNLQNNSS